LPGRAEAWIDRAPLLKAISRGSIVKTVVLDVRPPSEAVTDFTNAWKTGKASGTDRISFASPPELLWKVLTNAQRLCRAGLWCRCGHIDRDQLHRARGIRAMDAAAPAMARAARRRPDRRSR